MGNRASSRNCQEAPYYPGQAQFPPPIPPAPVIMNPAPHQPSLPPPQQQQQKALTKRERKKIRIRDPNQGGRDITDEIMSGGQPASTPTSLQSAMSVPEGAARSNTNNDSGQPATGGSRTESRGIPPPHRPMPLSPEVPIPPGEDLLPDVPPSPPTTSPISDTVDAPPPPPELINKVKTQDPSPSTAVPVTMPTTTVMPDGRSATPQESPIAQPEELQLYNGLATICNSAHVSPLAEPDTQKEAPLPVGEANTFSHMYPNKNIQEISKDMPTTGHEESPAGDGRETHFPVFDETPPASVKCETPVPATETPESSIVTHVSATESLVPATETPVSSTVTTVPSMVTPLPVKETPVPATETPVPLLKDMSFSLITDNPAADIQELPAKVPTQAPTPTMIEICSPFVKETLAALVNETPELIPQASDSSSVRMPRSPIVEATVSETNSVASPVLVTETSADSDTLSDGTKLTVSDAQPTVTSIPPALADDKVKTSQTPPNATESTIQAATSVPKRKRKMKELNKKDVVGDLLDAFKETVPTPPEPEVPHQSPPPTGEELAKAPPTEEIEETWEEREDKLGVQASQPQHSAVKTPTDSSHSESNKTCQPQQSSSGSPSDQIYKYKEEEWKPLNLEAKKRYDREFLLGFQFISVSMSKPEGLPPINDVVLDKANKTPLRPNEGLRMASGVSSGPDFTPSFANLGRQAASTRSPSSSALSGPRRSGQGSRKEPRKIIASVSLGDEVQLNRSEHAWRPSSRRRPEEGESSVDNGTEELVRRVRSVLNKLTPQMFQPLMRQLSDMNIDSQPRLQAVIDLVFEKAVDEPNFSVAYANMCRCLMGLKVPVADKPGATVNFRKLLLNRCQKEFEKDKDDDEIFEKKQLELEAASSEDEQQRLREELEEARAKARRRSLGNIKFIGELFKLKMLTEAIMHDCVLKLLKHHDEESLECLCRLLSTIGKDLDFDKAKPRMDQYFHQMEKIIKEKKTSSRIRFMLQDVLDLRQSNWVPRRGPQGPKTIEQIHREAQQEEEREQVKVQQQLLSKKEARVGGSQRPGPLHAHAGSSPRPSGPGPDEGWNTVPISSKNRSIDPNRLSKITKPGVLDFNTQLLAPGGKGTWGSWGKGSSGGTRAKAADMAQETTRTSTLNRFSALQQSSSSPASDMDRKTPQRNSSSRERADRYERSGERLDRRGDRDVDRGRDERAPEERPRDERSRTTMGKGSYSREREQRSGEGPRRVTSGSRERGLGKDAPVKREPLPSVPAPVAKLSEEEVEKKSNAIIEEYLHINDLKEALQCVSELRSASPQLSVFVRTSVEATLERSSQAREHMGQLLHALVKAGTLHTQQYYKGLQEILEMADDMAIDIPHIWLYLAQLVTPMLQEGGIPMGTLFRELSKPLLPIGKAGVFLAQILHLLCKGMSHKKVTQMWVEAALNWRDFLPEDEDVNKFVTDKEVEYTVGHEAVKGKGATPLSPQQLRTELECLLQDKPDNQRIYNWVEANLDEKQIASSAFVRALMISVCQAALICEKPYRVDTNKISQRASLLQHFLNNEQRELQALYALQSLMVQLEQPPNLLRMFFDVLYDEDVVKEEAFYSWEACKDPAEQMGKGVALKSVTAFFTWLREAEEESDNS